MYVQCNNNIIYNIADTKNDHIHDQENKYN